MLISFVKIIRVANIMKISGTDFQDIDGKPRSVFAISPPRDESTGSCDSQSPVAEI